MMIGWLTQEVFRWYDNLWSPHTRDRANSHTKQPGEIHTIARVRKGLKLQTLLLNNWWCPPDHLVCRVLQHPFKFTKLILQHCLPMLPLTLLAATPPSFLNSPSSPSHFAKFLHTALRGVPAWRSAPFWPVICPDSLVYTPFILHRCECDGWS